MDQRLQLCDGNSIPIIGLGTSFALETEVQNSVLFAIEAGYRHIDTATFYKNERQIGDTLQALIGYGKIKREELFVTTKVWNTQHRCVETACRKSLARLHLDYLDLYLIHWPVAFKQSDSSVPRREDGSVDTDDVKLEDTWKSMEALVKAGLVKSIGISNFNEQQIKRILEVAEIKPSVHQIEMHVDFPNRSLVEYSMKVGMVVVAYSPLGAPHMDKSGPDPLVKRKWIMNMAEKYQKSPAQLLLRYLIQRGVCIIPKSVNKARVEENCQIFDFQISEDDMKLLNIEGLNKRSIDMDWLKGHPEYPF